MSLQFFNHINATLNYPDQSDLQINWLVPFVYKRDIPAVLLSLLMNSHISSSRSCSTIMFTQEFSYPIWPRWPRIGWHIFNFSKTAEGIYSKLSTNVPHEVLTKCCYFLSWFEIQYGHRCLLLADIQEAGKL